MRKIHQLWKWLQPLHRAVMAGFGPHVSHGGPPSGCFSEAAEIAAGRVEGRHLSTLQPLVLHSDSEVIQAGLGQGDHSNWRAVWSHRSDTLLLGPSLVHVDAQGRACTEAMYGPHAWMDPVWRRHRRCNQVALHGPHTSIISRWNQGDSYYHWLLDGLTRLIHLDRFPSDTRIIIPANLPDFAVRSIEWLGLSDRIVPTTEGDLRVEDYWFAGPTMLSGCPDPLGVSWLRNKFISHQAIPGTDLIYVDRGQHRRKCKNGDDVTNWFKSRGWLVVNPGEMTLDQQISTFGRAKMVAGIHGAGLTNILWMPAGGNVFEIMPSKRRNGCYAGLAACIGASHKSLVVKSDRRANINVSLSSLEDWITF
jgi:hypothetical protein